MNAQETFDAIKATIADAKAEECARIRRELLAESERWETARGDGSSAQVWKESAMAQCASDLRAAIDRICPPEKGE